MSRAEARANAGAACIFAALGDETRLTLLSRLSGSDSKSITDLSQGLPLSRQAVTKHLRVLERVGLVESSRVGRESRFSFRPKRVEEAKRYLEVVSAQWDDALTRLRDFVEAPAGG